jgi:hypothetical protein
MVYGYCIDEYMVDDPDSAHWFGNDLFADAHFLRINGVCAQMRSEFRPFSLVNVHKFIPLEKIEAYFDLFHAGSPEVADHITVDLSSIIPVRAPRFDLINIFRQLADHPDIHCAFVALTSYRWGTARTRGLRAILIRCARHITNADFNEGIDKVNSIVPNGKTKNVVVQVKSRYKLKTQERSDFETTFRKTLGLRDSAPWSVLIKYGGV